MLMASLSPLAIWNLLFGMTILLNLVKQQLQQHIYRYSMNNCPVNSCQQHQHCRYTYAQTRTLNLTSPNQPEHSSGISVTSPHLNLLLVLKQGCLKDVPQRKVLTLYIKRVACQFSNALPVSRFHCLVGHQFEQRHHVIEVLDGLAQVLVCLPLLEGSWQLATPAAHTVCVQTYCNSACLCHKRVKHNYAVAQWSERRTVNRES